MTLIRVKIIFERPVVNEREQCWMLVNTSTCKLVYDLEYLIGKKFFGDGHGVLNLYLDEFLLPSQEKIEIIRENDIIRVKEDEVPLSKNETSKDKKINSHNSKKRKLENCSDSQKKSKKVKYSFNRSKKEEMVVSGKQSYQSNKHKASDRTSLKSFKNKNKVKRASEFLQKVSSIDNAKRTSQNKTASMVNGDGQKKKQPLKKQLKEKFKSNLLQTFLDKKNSTARKEKPNVSTIPMSDAGTTPKKSLNSALGINATEHKKLVKSVQNVDKDQCAAKGLTSKCKQETEPKDLRDTSSGTSLPTGVYSSPTTTESDDDNVEQIRKSHSISNTNKSKQDLKKSAEAMKNDIKDLKNGLSSSTTLSIETDIARNGNLVQNENGNLSSRGIATTTAQRGKAKSGKKESVPQSSKTISSSESETASSSRSSSSCSLSSSSDSDDDTNMLVQNNKSAGSSVSKPSEAQEVVKPDKESYGISSSGSMPKPNKKPNVCYSKQGNHIRFGNDSEVESIASNGISSVHNVLPVCPTTSTNKSGTKESSHFCTIVPDVNNAAFVNSVQDKSLNRRQKGGQKAFRKDVYTNKSIVMESTRLEKEPQESVPVPDNTPEKDFSKYQLLHGPPRVGETVAYKILELSQSYTPEISIYKEGKVLAFDPASNQLKLKLTKESLSRARGDGQVTLKFELVDGDDQDGEPKWPVEMTDEVEVQWSSMIEPRLVVQHNDT